MYRVAMDKPILDDKGMQSFMWKEHIEQLIPDILKHLIIQFVPQGQNTTEETPKEEKCSHMSGFSWKEIVDLLVRDHSATCSRHPQNAKEFGVIVSVNLPEYAAVSVPVTVQGESGGANDIEVESVEEKPVKEEREDVNGGIDSFDAAETESMSSGDDQGPECEKLASGDDQAPECENLAKGQNLDKYESDKTQPGETIGQENDQMKEKQVKEEREDVDSDIDSFDATETESMSSGDDQVPESEKLPKSQDLDKHESDETQQGEKIGQENNQVVEKQVEEEGEDTDSDVDSFDATETESISESSGDDQVPECELVSGDDNIPEREKLAKSLDLDKCESDKTQQKKKIGQEYNHKKMFYVSQKESNKKEVVVHVHVTNVAKVTPDKKATNEIGPGTDKTHVQEKKQYPCPHCERICRTESSWQNHVKRVHNSLEILAKLHLNLPSDNGRTKDQTYPCPVCKKQFKSPVGLNLHHKTHTKDPSRYSCPYCPRTCRAEDILQRHVKTHTTIKKPKCETCGKTHMKPEEEYTCPRKRILQCKVCKKIFKRPHHLRGHEKIHLRPTEYPCKHCGKVFRAAQFLKRHEVIHNGMSPHKCELCGESYRQAAKLKQHKARAHKIFEQHRCDQCSMVFRQKATLDDHMLEHTGKVSLLCDLCGKSFSRKTIYRLHLRRHKDEANPKAFPCSQCHRAYPNQGRLNIHIRQSHLQERSHKCSFCNKRYFKRFQLNTHEKLHTGQFDFKCTYCDKKFLTKSQLVSHERIHTGLRPWHCAICTKTFTRKEFLNRHMSKHHSNQQNEKRVEKQAQCPICGAVFSQVSACLQHQKRHAGIKDQVCDVCGAAFVGKGDLIRHMKIHTDGKPYRCEQCRSTFAKKTELNQHVVIHVNLQQGSDQG